MYQFIMLFKISHHKTKYHRFFFVFFLFFFSFFLLKMDFHLVLHFISHKRIHHFPFELIYELIYGKRLFVSYMKFYIDTDNNSNNFHFQKKKSIWHLNVILYGVIINGLIVNWIAFSRLFLSMQWFIRFFFWSTIFMIKRIFLII